MSTRHVHGDARRSRARASAPLLACAGALLVCIAGLLLFRAQEHIALARKRDVATEEWGARQPIPSNELLEREANTPVAAASPRVDRAALLRVLAQRELAQRAATGSQPARAAAPELSREYVASGIRSAIPLLTECYDALREKQPEAAGTVRISATIDAEPEIGAVVSESDVSNPSGGDGLASDAEFSRCLRETMRTIELEPPERAGRATFSFPLRFGAHPSSDGGSR